jgi:hypothetical protein
MKAYLITITLFGLFAAWGILTALENLRAAVGG